MKKKTIVDDIISEFSYRLKRDIKQRIKNNMDETLDKILKTDTVNLDFYKRVPETENKVKELLL